MLAIDTIKTTGGILTIEALITAITPIEAGVINSTETGMETSTEIDTEISTTTNIIILVAIMAITVSTAPTEVATITMGSIITIVNTTSAAIKNTEVITITTITNLIAMIDTVIVR